jgi:hypothetical protein
MPLPTFVPESLLVSERAFNSVGSQEASSGVLFNVPGGNHSARFYSGPDEISQLVV